MHQQNTGLPAPMDFAQFCQKYPYISREEIATIAGCGVDLVNRWFMKGRTSREPTKDHLDRLAVADWLWSIDEKEPEYIQYIRSVKVKMSDRADDL